jgi:hypothetical protein
LDKEFIILLESKIDKEGRDVEKSLAFREIGEKLIPLKEPKELKGLKFVLSIFFFIIF